MTIDEMIRRCTCKQRDAVTALISSFIAQFDCTCVYGGYFMFDSETNFIQWNCSEVEEGKAHLTNIIKEIDNTLDLSMLTISILHEVGHKYTLPNISYKEYLKAEKVEKHILQNRKKRGAYFYTKRERVATEWGAQWASAHKKEIEKFEKNLKKLLTNNNK